jgi:hypothetical protein
MTILLAAVAALATGAPGLLWPPAAAAAPLTRAPVTASPPRAAATGTRTAAAVTPVTASPPRAAATGTAVAAAAAAPVTASPPQAASTGTAAAAAAAAPVTASPPHAAATGTAAAAAAAAPLPPTAEDVVRAMHERWAGTWYRTLTFVQKTTTYGPAGNVAGVETWYESMEMPGRLRIDVAPVGEGRVLLFRSDSLYVVQGGQGAAPAPPRPLVHGLLLMGFDVYHQPPEETLAKLAGLGVDLSSVHETTWQDRAVWVIGAAAGDETSNQFWVDRERLVFVRQLNGAREVRFNAYEPLGQAWISPEVAIFNEGRLVTLEEYSDMRVGMTFEDGVFDPARLTRPGWMPSGS